MTNPPPFNSGNPQQNPIPPYTPPTPNQPQKKKKDPILGAIAIVTLILAILCFSLDWFPSPQIIDFEAGIFGGSYYVKLTIIVVWMSIFLPAAGIYKLAQVMSKG